eukprot:CAMPEP_0204629784 /NCGR_PEP_ID=MMETSP0717-20131115/18901_1 /ASSEMBLY_ACC=CAM_ASM_000666 /TAXON_ID=230516 /ORGANISM="Chaetoceros curvisetus" /LENGTH=229 /DNA_ID=CAMNT_0051646825 /DNA_START=74 /DNA_END=763 /DNA_ORIENTATION=+
MSATDTQTVITLKGSVAIISEFFSTAINSILYQRGIYQPETFRRESKYGLTVLTTTDEGLLAYLKNIMDQMESWLLEGDVQRLVVVVSGVDSGETLERWQFNVSVDDKDRAPSTSSGNENDASATNASSSAAASCGKASGKSLKEIHNEMQAIIRQITASVTFLPLLNEPCSFDLLVYTNKTATVPQKWEDSDPRYIMNSQEVKLRSFTTSVHKIESMVTYKEADEWEL